MLEAIGFRRRPRERDLLIAYAEALEFHTASQAEELASP